MLSNRLDKIIDKEQHIAIAVSGGRDSMALCLLLSDWTKTKNIKLIALTVDHGLRNESRQEAEQVANWLDQRDIEHHILTWKPNKNLRNLQQEARDARYKLMCDYCKKNSISSLFLAHHLEDQAETFMMRLMRGSSVYGLKSMQEISQRDNIKLVRPLLNISRTELADFLNSKKQEWIEDPSNQNEQFDRVKIRNLFGNIEDSDLFIKRLADTANHFTRVADYIDQNIAKEMKDTVTESPLGYYIISIDEFLNLHQESALRILSIILKNISGNHYPPRFDALFDLYEEFSKEKYLKGRTLWGTKLWSKENTLFIAREHQAIGPDIELSKENIWDKRFLCKADANICIRALGAKGRLFLRDQGFKFDQEIPIYVIESLPAFYIKDSLKAVPLIGYFKEKNYAEFISYKI